MNPSVGSGTDIDVDDEPRSLWRNRDFTLLWCSQTLSDLGGSATWLAIPLLVLSVTGSAADAGVAGTAAAVSRLVLRLPGGALADRWNRRRVMLISDAARVTLLTILIAAIALKFVSFPLILILVIGLGAFDIIFQPAEAASIPRLVSKPQLSQAFAQNEARQYAASLAGPPLGGLLYGVGRAVPFLFDLITYAVSFCAIAAIRGPIDAQPEAPAASSVAAQVREGLAHVWQSRFLRAVVMVAAPLNFGLLGALFAATVVLRQEGLAASTVGLAQGAAALGGLLGAFAAPALIKRLSLRQIVIVVAWILVVCMVATAILTGRLAMVLPLALGLFFAPAANAALFGHLAATTPDHLLGRVTSVIIFAATSAAALAPLSTGSVVEYLDGRSAVLLCAMAITGSAVAATLSAGLRDTPTDPSGQSAA